MSELNYQENTEQFIKLVFEGFNNKIKLRCISGTSWKKIEETIKELKREYPVVNAAESAAIFCMKCEDVVRWLNIAVSGRLEDKAIIFYPETYMHPTEIRNVVTSCVQALIDNKRDTDIDLIFVTNSPIILSDFPSSNVTFFDAGFDRLTETKHASHIGTFAGNLYDIYVNALMDTNKAVLGSLCAKMINKVVDLSREGKATETQVLGLAYLVEDDFLSKSISQLNYEK